MDRRTEARQLAMQALYQLDVQGEDVLGGLDIFFKASSCDDMVFELAREWTKGTWENKCFCDELIEAAAVRWQVSRLGQVDKSILRLSAYQLKFCPEIPGKVVINEAIEIAKKYSAKQSPGFVNGVLDAILKNLRSEEDSKKNNTVEENC